MSCARLFLREPDEMRLMFHYKIDSESAVKYFQECQTKEADFFPRCISVRREVSICDKTRARLAKNQLKSRNDKCFPSRLASAIERRFTVISLRPQNKAEEEDDAPHAP